MKTDDMTPMEEIPEEKKNSRKAWVLAPVVASC